MRVRLDGMRRFQYKPAIPGIGSPAGIRLAAYPMLYHTSMSDPRA